ncbi:MAG: NADH-quinone oxidoreductase subunit G [Actinomycetota bacterium]
MSDHDERLVTLTVDGKEVTVPEGTLIIRAAEALGIEIPRFCDHPLLDPVAACRQCYVHVEGQRKLMTSCSTPVADGMIVQTQNSNDEVREAQESVLEFLLINHPLDCPICDRGGECPLQDQALGFGTGVSRYVEPKRTFKKPLPLSPLVNLDRERCVLCARCTRFCDEISGDRFIELFSRGAAEQVSIAPGEDFASPFSGNTVQICPVGALTSTPYRFAARPFDLAFEDTVCPHCACGCNIRVDTRRGEVVRHLARDNYDVNDAWLCDKGRSAFRWPDLDRLELPLLRRGGGLEPASFEEVFEAIAGWASGGRVAVLAGGRLSDESAYALSKLARVGFGTNDVDHRLLGSPDVPLSVDAAQAAGTPVTYADVERAGAIVLVGLDAENELPILHLRIRKAVRKTGASVFVIGPRRTRLHDVAEHLPCPPGGEANLLASIAQAADPATVHGRLAEALREAGSSGIVLAGPRLAESAGAVGQTVALAQRSGARFASVCRRANDRGALVGGLHPALLPGGRPVEDEAARAEVEVTWGALTPKRPGRDASEILQACADHQIDVLYLVGVDPLRDFPDADLARRALANVRYKVVQDAVRGDLDIYADAMLPAAPFLETDGHYTTWEGRSQRLRRTRPPRGLARDDWEIFQGVGEALGKDLRFATLEALQEELAGLLGTREVPVSVSTGTAALALGDAGDTLALFSYPLLVDEGRLSAGADELKAALEEPAFVEVHPDDAGRLGLLDATPVKVSTAAGEATLPVRVSAGVARGAAFVPFNNPGLAANTLLSGKHHTAARVEPIEGAP